MVIDEELEKMKKACEELSQILCKPNEENVAKLFINCKYYDIVL